MVINDDEREKNSGLSYVAHSRKAFNKLSKKYEGVMFEIVDEGTNHEWDVILNPNYEENL